MLGVIGWEYKHDGWSQMTTDPCFSDPDATLNQLKSAIEGAGMHEGYENDHGFALYQYQAIKYRPRLVRAVRVMIKAYVFEDGVWHEKDYYPLRNADEITDVSFYQQDKKETAKQLS
ncbi:MAG TPA: hypothetical protein DCM07_29370 [Planctomycetaceae bacterium]|nr:hypothetical protein [Gimesia sp.]HAH48877.1 hypothetical protein [Planctomycetaceae bacterium]|tara:strand:+ start:5418 stop:5768 length:351 start_codon:yes stop_codon:yes gene_type:complete